MSSFQFRLWKKMIRLIQDFYDGKVLFHPLVDGLRKDLDQAQLQDGVLLRKWYDYFNPLEEADSEAWYEMKDLEYEKIFPLLQKMKYFLLEQGHLMGASFTQVQPRRKLAHSKH